jgi:HSP20 family protein
MFGLTPWKKKEAGGSMTSPREHLLRQLRDEFDSLFDRFFGGWSTPFAADRRHLPRFWDFDLEDAGDHVVVRAEAPGFENDDFDVQVNGNQLTIRAEKKHEEKDKCNGHSYAERRLHRSVTLPAGADTEKVEATYRNGVLEIQLPKSPEARGKRNTVKS